MNDVAQQRLAEIMAFQGALQAIWPIFSKELEKRRQENILRLIASDNEEARGRIKELSDLLDLPQRLNQEALHLASELP